MPASRANASQRPPASAPLIVQTESIVPWVTASVLVCGAYILGLVAGTAGSGSIKAQVVLTISLCAVLIATQFVRQRSKVEVEDASRTNRARPAFEELAAWSTHRPLLHEPSDQHLPPYAEGMLRYSAAVIELLEQSVAVALDQGLDTTELAAGRDDAAALHSLLSAMANEPVQLQKAAKIHTICSLWETGQERCERAAAELDPEFHRRWRARHVAVLRLRHGERPLRRERALPYQA